MLASFTEISEEELAALEAKAEENDTIGLDDYNKSVLEALKSKMQEE
jgi:hypothetical protein